MTFRHKHSDSSMISWLLADHRIQILDSGTNVFIKFIIQIKFCLSSLYFTSRFKNMYLLLRIDQFLLHLFKCLLGHDNSQNNIIFNSCQSDLVCTTTSKHWGCTMHCIYNLANSSYILFLDLYSDS